MSSRIGGSSVVIVHLRTKGHGVFIQLRCQFPDMIKNYTEVEFVMLTAIAARYIGVLSANPTRDIDVNVL
jgi:hypothetical protein